MNVDRSISARILDNKAAWSQRFVLRFTGLLLAALLTAMTITTAHAAEPKSADQKAAERAVEAILKMYAEGFRTRDPQKLTSPEMYFTDDSSDDHYVLFDCMPSLSKDKPYVDEGAKNLLEKNIKYVDVTSGPTIVHWTEQHIDGDGKFAFFRGIMNAKFTYKDGRVFDTKLRHTLVLKKIHGKYLIIHEHASVPSSEVGLDTPTQAKATP